MNEQLATYFERLAGSKPVQQILHRMRLDPRQFVLFLGLLRTLSERDEFTGIIGVNRFTVSYLALFAFGIGIIPWALLAHVLHARMFLMLNLFFTYGLLFLMVIREAANSLLNPVEASMLAHEPIHPPTYTAAKIAHVLIAVLYLVPGLAAYPALMGLQSKGARWFWPFTHLISAFSIGFWTAVFICALYGWMRRFVPVYRLKGLSISIQIWSLIFFVTVPIFHMSFLLKMLMTQFENTRWTWLPPVWLAEIGLMGCSDAGWILSWEGLLACGASALFIWGGLRSFSGAYLSEGSSMVEGASRRTPHGSTLSRTLVKLIGFLTGSASGIGAFYLVSKFIRRDWQFGRLILTQAWLPIMALFALVLGAVRFGLPQSPISNEMSSVHIMPHLLGLITMVICSNISLSDLHSRGYIYLSSPVSNIRGFGKGIYWSIWVLTAALPHVVAIPVLMWVWSWKEIALATGFNLVVVSLYLAFQMRLISGPPFSCPANESKATTNVVYVQVCWSMAILFPVFVQSALFRHEWTAFSAGIILVIVTWFVLHHAFNELASEIRWRLYVMKMGTNQIFREFE